MRLSTTGIFVSNYASIAEMEFGQQETTLQTLTMGFNQKEVMGLVRGDGALHLCTECQDVQAVFYTKYYEELCSPKPLRNREP